MWFSDADTYAYEIDGMYSVFNRDLRDPNYVLFTKDCQNALQFITVALWKFYRLDFKGKEYCRVNMLIK